MKKCTILLTLIFSVLFIPTQVLAVDFTIENTQIDAFLQENGDVEISERHTYEFDGDFNGITRTLIPKENSLIQNVEAFDNGKSLEVEQEGNLFKIYRGGSSETITINLSYTIENGVEVYADLGQFYWPFFDNSNESTYENMDIYIHPPQPTEEVLAIGNDEAEGTAQIKTNGIVHFAMGEVRSGEKGDIRVAYDASLFPGAAMQEDKTIRDDILADIAAYGDKMANYENRKGIISSIAPYIVGVFLIFLLVLIVRAWRKRKTILWEVERNSLQDSLLPREEMSLPATILHIKNMSMNGDLLSAALLDLVRKGFIDQKNESEFVVVNHSTDHPHEEILIEWLFYKIGNDGKFSIDTLEKYTDDKENAQLYYEDLMKWLEAVKAEIKQHNLVEKKIGLRWTVACSSLLLIPFTILLGVHDLILWMLLSLLLSATLLIFAILYQPKTLKGARIKHHWNQFSYNYNKIDEKQWNKWMSDEQMQAFIYAIGSNNKNMQNKYEKLSNLASNSNSGFDSTSTDMMMFLLIASTMKTRFNEADQTVSAATVVSAGAGGGTGVGGGGGGSGAF